MKEKNNIFPNCHFSAIYALTFASETNTKHIMEKLNLNDGLMAIMLEQDAWYNLSYEFNWNEQLLEKYQDKLDWESVSRSSNIHWTVPMLEKFRHKIDWKELSGTCQKSILCLEVVEKFENYWDWTVLSGNNYLPMATVEKMADRIVWKEAVNSYRSSDEDVFYEQLLEKFSDRIPASILKDSRLWNVLVEKKQEEILQRICLEK